MENVNVGGNGGGNMPASVIDFLVAGSKDDPLVNVAVEPFDGDDKTKRLTRRATFSGDVGKAETSQQSQNFEQSPEWAGFGNVSSEEESFEAENQPPNHQYLPSGRSSSMDNGVKQKKQLLRRVNSAELVRKAFPQMLFDRCSPVEGAPTAFGEYHPDNMSEDGDLPEAPPHARFENGREFYSHSLSSENSSGSSLDPAAQYSEHQYQQHPAPPVNMYNVPQSMHQQQHMYAEMQAMHSHFMYLQLAQQAAINHAAMMVPPMMQQSVPVNPAGMYYQANMQNNIREARPPPGMAAQPHESRASRGNSPPNSATTSRSVSPNSQGETLLAQLKQQNVKPTPAQLVGNVLAFSKDSHGSRHLQSVVSTCTQNEKLRLIDEVLDSCIDLMHDLFGNYVLQVFLQHASDEQRRAIANYCRGRVLDLSLHAHGCRVIQRLLDVIEPVTRAELLGELLVEENISIAAMDAHATHVLQKAVVLLQQDLYNVDVVGRDKRKKQDDKRKHAERKVAISDKRAILEQERAMLNRLETFVSVHTLMLAVHPHGCRLVQRILADCNRTRSKRIAAMIDCLETQYDSLSRHQHGNFILQHILEFGQNDQANRIQNYVGQRVIEFSTHKFASHLVEKALVCADARRGLMIIDTLLNAPQLPQLMRDPYANFVLQRAFDIADSTQKGRIAKEVQNLSSTLSEYTHYRHLHTYIQKASNKAP